MLHPASVIWVSVVIRTQWTGCVATDFPVAAFLFGRTMYGKTLIPFMREVRYFAAPSNKGGWYVCIHKEKKKGAALAEKRHFH